MKTRALFITFVTSFRIFATLTVLVCGSLLAFPRGALAEPAVIGGTFHVNSAADNIDPDNYITLREAMMIARGGTGASGLNRHLTTAEKNLLSGCTFSFDREQGDWSADKKCGKGNDTIVFKLTDCPCNIYPLTPLPALQNDSIDGYSQSSSSVNTSKKGMNAKIMVQLIGAVAAPGVDGLDITGSGSTVKGLSITEFPGFGINITGGAAHILGNVVYANGQNGIAMSGGSNSIGDMTLAGRNAIYENHWHGAEAFGNAGNNSIVNNLIGLAPNKSTPEPGNLFSGISIYSSNNVIEHNIIADNLNNGILIITGTQNIFEDNSISYNGWQGIDLGNNGVTLNDDTAKDADTGANTLQNYPELSAANHTTKQVKGKLTSTPNTTIQLSFYANPSCSGSGHGEGKTYLGGLQVQTNSAGTAKFSVTLGTKFGAGNAITALASANTGTSEFSQCITAQ